MNLRQLEILQAVMENGSVTGAAKALNISQPSVSKMLRHAESQLGIELFRRVKSRLHPTPEARALKEEMLRVYRGLKSIESMAREMRAGREGHLRLAATSALGLNLAPKVLASFLEKRPTVRSSLMVRPVEQVEEMVASQQTDLGLVLFPTGNLSVKTATLSVARMVAVVPKGHELAGRERLNPGDFADYRYIGFDRQTPFGRMITTYFQNAKVSVDNAAEIELCSAACSLVSAGVGIAIVDPYTAAGPVFPAITTVPLDPPLEFELSLLLPLHRPESVLTRMFLEHLATLEFPEFNAKIAIGTEENITDHLYCS